MEQYDEFLSLIAENKGTTSIAERKKFASKAFNISSHYDKQVKPLLKHYDMVKTLIKKGISLVI